MYIQVSIYQLEFTSFCLNGVVQHWTSNFSEICHSLHAPIAVVNMCQHLVQSL